MPKSSSGIQKILPVVATLFVVVGIVVIVFIRRPAPPLSNDGPGVPMPMNTSGTTALVVFQEAEAIRVVGTGADGKMTSMATCPLSGEAARIVRVNSQGIEIATGGEGRAHMGFDCTATTSTLPAGLLNPSATRGAQVAEARADGTGAVMIITGTEERIVVLRGSNGRPYRDPELIEWMDNDHLAVMAFQGDTRHVLAITVTGQITQLVTLPEEVGGIAAGGGMLWYVTATPGEGIEFGPHGPSELHRVDASGKREKVAGDDGVFESLSAGPGGQFAVNGSGALITGTFGATRNIGTGTPTGWMDDGTLLVVRNELLVLAPPDADAQVKETNVSIPTDVDWVWSIPLDAIPPTE